MEQPGFFNNADEQLKVLTVAGDPLIQLAAVVDFEVFPGELEPALALARTGRRGAGRHTMRW